MNGGGVGFEAMAAPASADAVATEMAESLGKVVIVVAVLSIIIEDRSTCVMGVVLLKGQIRDICEPQRWDDRWDYSGAGGGLLDLDSRSMLVVMDYVPPYFMLSPDCVRLPAGRKSSANVSPLVLCEAACFHLCSAAVISSIQAVLSFHYQRKLIPNLPASLRFSNNI